MKPRVKNQFFLCVRKYGEKRAFTLELMQINGKFSEFPKGHDKIEGGG